MREPTKNRGSEQTSPSVSHFAGRILARIVLVVFVAASSVSFSSPAKAQVGEAAAVGVLIDEFGTRLFGKLDDSVNNFFNRVDNSVINFRLQLDGILSRMRSEFQDIVELSVAELNNQQRQLWQDYVSALNRLEIQIDRHLVDVRITMLDFANAAGTFVPFSDSRPFIYWVEVDPPLFVHNAPVRSYTAFGINLDHEGNTLIVNGNAARRSSPSPTTLVFVEEHSDVSRGVVLEYSLFERRSLLADRQHVMPRVEFTPLVDYIGDIRLVYSVPRFREITRRWPADENQRLRGRCRNPNASHRCSTGIATEVINARSGFSILPDTVRIHKDVHRDGCRENTLKFDAVSGASFRISGNARANRGYRRVCDFAVHFTWTERQNVGTPQERLTDFQRFRRSTNGLSIQYPSRGATAIALEFRDATSRSVERHNLPPTRLPLRAEAGRGSGVVELVWGR